MTWISRHSWDEAAERVTKNHLARQDHAQCSIWSFWRSLLYEAIANCKCQCFCFLRSWPTGIAKTPPPLPWRWEIMILSSTFVVLLLYLQFESNIVNSLCNAHVCFLSFFQNPAWRIYSPCFVVMEFLHLHICTGHGEFPAGWWGCRTWMADHHCVAHLLLCPLNPGRVLAVQKGHNWRESI